MRQYIGSHATMAREAMIEAARAECIRDAVDIFVDWGYAVEGSAFRPRFTVFWHLPNCATGPHRQDTDSNPRTLSPLTGIGVAEVADCADDLPDPENDRVVRVAHLKQKIAAYEAYLDVCRADRDWHGVMDACADIREYEAMVNALTP